MDRIADDIFSLSQLNIEKKGISDTGFLMGQANVNRSFLEKKIVYSAPYAMSIEFGSQPHVVPFNAIFQWAQRKLGMSKKAAYPFARNVVRKIAERGTVAQPFLRPAIEEVKMAYGGAIS